LQIFSRVENPYSAFAWGDFGGLWDYLLFCCQRPPLDRINSFDRPCRGVLCMAILDNRPDRWYWGCGNLAGAIACLPICWGLPSPDWAALKFGSAIAGAVLGVNAARLISQHSENAPIRSAWKESATMVNAAWIEQLAISQLPQQPTYQPMQQQVSATAENYYLSAQPPDLNFQPIAEQRQNEASPERGGDRKMPNLSAYPAVLVYGVPGTGKTTFSEQEVQKRLALGHQVIVLDPHAAYGGWKGCEVVGGGMDYKAIEDKLQWLFKEVKERYSRIKSEPNPEFKSLSIIAEEFTKWSKKVKSSGELFWTSLTDIRKIEIHILFVSHTRTLIALGDAKGASELRDDGLLEIELQGELNDQTGKATPTFQALVKMPGKSLNDRFLVAIDRISGNTATATPEASLSVPGSNGKLPITGAEQPGNLYGMRSEADSAILMEILTEPGRLAVFSPALDLQHEEKLKLAKIIIAKNLGTEITILCLWGVRSGGRNHHLYVEAKAMLERLIKE
jgi:hypothetical protein